jgi:hypothetical protein
VSWRAAGLLLSWSMLAAPATGGVEIETRTRSLDGGSGKTSYTFWLEADRLAAEPRRPGTPPARRRIVYLAEQDLMWFIDTKRETYYQLDQAGAEATASQVKGLKEDLASVLAGLDPEVRGRAEKLLGKLETDGSAPLPEVSLRERGELGSYAGVACARHDVIAEEKRLGEICVADWESAGAAAEAKPLIPSLIHFIRTSLEPLARELPMIEPLLAIGALEGTPGLPLQTRTFSDDEPDTETLVKAIREVQVDADLFTLPEGYARSWVPPFN